MITKEKIISAILNSRADNVFCQHYALVQIVDYEPDCFRYYSKCFVQRGIPFEELVSCVKNSDQERLVLRNFIENILVIFGIRYIEPKALFYDMLKEIDVDK